MNFSFFDRPYARILGLALLPALGLAPKIARACACGCGIFDVGTSSMFPNQTGSTLLLEDDFQDQTANWSGDAKAPAADNPDKEIRTNFVTLGYQDMVSRDWGMQLDVPSATRYFRTTGGATGDQIVAFKWNALSDLRLQGIYTGFSPDLSSGMTFGLKLPTGDFRHNDAFGDIDRDSEVGTGSTDLLLGGYHRASLPGNPAWTWFAEVQLDLPLLVQDDYRPGAEADLASGLYHHGWSIGRATLTPMAEAKISVRGRDTGLAAANPVASGFQRLLLVPGVECDWHPLTVYADVELPVYQNFTGDQLAAPALFKLAISYMF